MEMIGDTEAHRDTGLRDVRKSEKHSICIYRDRYDL